MIIDFKYNEDLHSFNKNVIVRCENKTSTIIKYFEFVNNYNNNMIYWNFGTGINKKNQKIKLSPYQHSAYIDRPIWMG